MASEAPLIPWLEHLRQLYPPQGVVVVGAGNGTGPWIQALRRWNTEHVTLVEADDGQFQHLQRSAADREHWLLRKQVVAHASQSVTFHLASNPAENGLLEPEHLRTLWPNLETREKQTREAITLADLLQGVTPQPNWLWLDCLPAASLLQGAGKTLDGMNVILVRGLQPGAEVPADDDAASSIQAVTRQLQVRGFVWVATESGRHPGIAHAVYVQDYAAQFAKASADYANQLQAVQVELSQVRRQAQSTARALASARAEAEQAHRAAEQAGEQVRDAQARADQTEAQAAQSCAEQARQLQAVQAELSQTRQQAEHTAAALAAARTEVEQAHRVAEQADEQARQAQGRAAKAEAQAAQASVELVRNVEAQPQILGALQEIASTLKDGIESLQTNLARQTDQLAPDQAALRAGLTAIGDRLTQQQSILRTFAQQNNPTDIIKAMATTLEDLLAKQLAGGQESLKEVGARLRDEMNKGLANAVKQVEAFINIQNYLSSGELLMDFHGWPISPDIGLLLLEKMRERRYNLILEFGSGTSTALFAKGVEVIARPVAAAKDMVAETVTEVVSFEHDTRYYSQTQQMLESRGLADRVQLVHAPLIDWCEGEQHYLYYDCEATLAALAEKYAHRHIRILLLVDGPPGGTCINARYPAVPLVFNAFGKHDVDVALDDANRTEEKTVIELWRTFWKKRSVHMNEFSLASEKGIYFATPKTAHYA